jgi:hypothetical protein
VIVLHTNDEHAQWVATVTLNGTATDYSSGYTFTCVVANKTTGTTLLTKTTGITGAASGAITVAFTGAELATATVTATYGAPVEYAMFLTPRKTADSSDGPTVEETLQMRYRP